jgi:hypothetical protein
MQTQAYMTLNIQLYTRKAWKTMKMPPYDGLIFSHHSIVEFFDGNKRDSQLQHYWFVAKNCKRIIFLKEKVKPKHLGSITYSIGSVWVYTTVNVYLLLFLSCTVYKF